MRGKILVVDDDPDSGSLIAQILSLRAFDAGSVGSARECLEQLNLATFDVVITDVRMPVMSGIELCRAIRDLHPDILVVVITGDPSRDSASEATAAGAYDYIYKPVTIGLLDVVLVQATSLARLRREVSGAGTVRVLVNG
ncbi:hypothetical protein BH11MYX3_BH11MYX3_15270 [soil metagenome]